MQVHFPAGWVLSGHKTEVHLDREPVLVLGLHTGRREGGQSGAGPFG